METIPVRFRDCSCPGTPHPDGDIAELRPYLDYPGGAEAVRVVRVLMASLPKGADIGDYLPEVIGPVFIRRGVVAWNLLDEDGDPVPVTPEALDALPWTDAYDLADRADDLYGGQVFAPFDPKTSPSSKGGRTGGSTRRPRKSSPTRPRPSESSS